MTLDNIALRKQEGTSSLNPHIQSSPISSTTTQAADRALQQRVRAKGYDLSEISACDLTQYRNADFPSIYSYLYFIPIVGWLALAYLKISYIAGHRAAEKELAKHGYSSNLSVSDKIEIMQKAIAASGRTAWKYNFELARLQLEKEDFTAAANTLSRIQRQIDSPTQTGHYNVRGKNIVSFIDAGPVYVDRHYVMRMHYHNAEQALFNAVIAAHQGNYAEAYDAYNEVTYYNPSISKSRLHQTELVRKMTEQPSLAGKRGQEILLAEEKLVSSTS